MLETLSNMDKTEGDHTFSTIADKCRESWTAALQASGEPEALSDGEIARLRRWQLDLYDLVNSRIPLVRYKNILRAQEIYQGLRNSQTPEIRAEDGIPDVLNAAWLYRLNMAEFNSYELDRIGEQAFQMCKEIAG